MSGIPETIHFMFQVEDDADPEPEDKYAMGYFVTMPQMPNNNNETGPGFSEEVLHLLLDRGLEILVPCFKEHNISMYRFLTLNETDLRSLGVEFSSDRREVLDMIKNFHLCRWQTLATFVMKPSKVPFTVVDGLDMVSRLTQHFYIETATIAYLRSRLGDVLKKQSSKDRTTLLQTLEKNIQEAQRMAETLRLSVVKLHQDLRKKTKFDNEVPADFICPRKQTWWRKKFVTVVAVSALITVSLWKSKMNELLTIRFPHCSILSQFRQPV